MRWPGAPRTVLGRWVGTCKAGASRNACRKLGGLEPSHKGSKASGRRKAFWRAVRRKGVTEDCSWGPLDTELPAW